jgi:6-phosphofructokinase 1
MKPAIPNTAITTLGKPTRNSPLTRAVADGLRIPSDICWAHGKPPSDLALFERAGPRSHIYFDPANVRAGIVTCGGLCPGLNNVIRSLVLELWHGYGVRQILGFQHGYGGLDPRTGAEPLPLNPETVEDIHREGGTILGTSRGPVDKPVAVDNLIARGINMLFTVGGDGTQQGALDLYKIARDRGADLALVGIPKTIDNDVPFVTRSFGFSTAVGIAREVIDSAHTEAHSVFNGVSLVKLMGRHAGFIAAAATVASQDVNFCLVPEVPFQLDGDTGFLAALEKRLAGRRHAVIVVAEGAGQELIAGDNGERDASGNIKLQDIGTYLKEKVVAHFRARNILLNMRLFDPGYQIRACPANTEDAVLCDRFARHAVHAAMAGKTGLVIGFQHDQFIHVPIELLPTVTKRLPLDGELWHATLAATGQPRKFGG